MKDEFSNRRAMHLTVLGYLDLPANIPIWKNKRPKAFTAKSALLRSKVAALGPIIAEQEATLTGHAAQKEREALDVEILAQEIGAALAGYHEDAGREGEAALTDFSITTWHTMRETSLLEKARFVHGKLVAALATDVAGLDDYGLEAADAAALLKEINEYAEIIKSPQTAKVTRKTLTVALRPSFRDVSEILVSMDRLVLRFRTDAAGKQFAAGWKNARRITDLGHGPSHEPSADQP
jgi:hypothetical protein